MQTRKKKDDYFNKIANDLLTPALGETIDNPDTIIVDAANWSGDGTNRGHEWPLLRNGDNDVYLMTLVHSHANGEWVLVRRRRHGGDVFREKNGRGGRIFPRLKRNGIRSQRHDRHGNVVSVAR